ncbi:MAG TPA: MraY family glycosyltransferase [Candidatus Acidoferrales bacterium]|nr:MraY family glycosyltransferase [Candidatus Acidoferrales bacterium]
MPLAALPLALVLALVLTPLAVRIAWTSGYLDHPEARKLHTSATALLGGAAVFVSALIAWGVAMRVMPHAPADWEAYYLLFGAGVALATGLWDDRFGMRPSVKMLAQAAAGVVLLAGGAIPRLGLPIGVDAAITLVALIGLMNAVNFLDNMNGMVAGLAAIALAGFAWTSMQRGANGIAAAQLALAGACLGFLPHNFPRARIFLGDAGSLFLGYSLGASALLAMNGARPGWGQAGPALVLAYPALDLLFVVVTRVRAGRPVYEGGKDHTNHRVAHVLHSTHVTVPLLWLLAALLCASGLLVLRLNQPAPTLAFCSAWVAALFWGGWRLAAVPVVHRG